MTSIERLLFALGILRIMIKRGGHIDGHSLRLQQKDVDEAVFEVRERITYHLDRMLERGRISEELRDACVEDIQSEDCEICGERKFSTVERDVPEQGEVGEHYYTKYMICDDCMAAAERRAEGPDPDLLYDEWRDRQAEGRE